MGLRPLALGPAGDRLQSRPAQARQAPLGQAWSVQLGKRDQPGVGDPGEAGFLAALPARSEVRFDGSTLLG